jgi:hypothetical protein
MKLRVKDFSDPKFHCYTFYSAVHLNATEAQE